jgi:hypothetical protein
MSVVYFTRALMSASKNRSDLSKVTFIVSDVFTRNADKFAHSSRVDANTYMTPRSFRCD